MTGLVIGLVVALLVFFIWRWYMSAETVVVFRTDPVADALLKYHRLSDPINSATIPRMRKERFDAQDEDPRLINKLWR